MTTLNIYENVETLKKALEKFSPTKLSDTSSLLFFLDTKIQAITKHNTTAKMQFTAIALAAIAATGAYAQVHNGVATYFYQNGNAGSCGQVHSVRPYLPIRSPLLTKCLTTGYRIPHRHVS
jgi:hypothetical protein